MEVLAAVVSAEFAADPNGTSGSYQWADSQGAGPGRKWRSVKRGWKKRRLGDGELIVTESKASFFSWFNPTRAVWLNERQKPQQHEAGSVARQPPKDRRRRPDFNVKVGGLAGISFALLAGCSQTRC